MMQLMKPQVIHLCLYFFFQVSLELNEVHHTYS